MRRSEAAIDAADFAERGYAVVPDALSPEEVGALVARARALITAFDPDDAGAPFTTDDTRRTIDHWFLDSGDRVRCFLEDDVPEGQPPAVNKIGHALHALDPVFGPVSRSERWRDVLAAAGVEAPRAVQSMYIGKDPGVGGAVAPHQDATFLHTTPSTVVGLWFALADADVRNGCLWALPGAHRAGIRRRFVREGDHTRFVELDEAPWPDDGWVPLEVPAGAMVVLHGCLPHRSARNESDRGRPAYAVHVVDAGARWSPDNWLRPA